MNLEREGFAVRAFALGHTALAYLDAAVAGREELPDIAVLDRTVPDMDGLDVMRHIRAEAGLSGMCVLMLTARAEELDRVLGLELGADDYVAKPFSFPELVARIRAVTRRSAPRAAAPERYLRHGLLQVDLEAFSVSVAGEAVALTRREFELLVYFLRHRGEVVTRPHLMRHVWRQPVAEENRTVDVHVRRLRAKLGAGLEKLETLVGVGYRLA